MLFIMISLAVSLLIVIFALQNSVIVPIHFFSWSTDVPLVLIIFISAFAGAVIIFCLALWKDMKRRFKSVSSKASDKATEIKGKASDYKEKSWLNKVKPANKDDTGLANQQKEQQAKSDPSLNTEQRTTVSATEATSNSLTYSEKDQKKGD